MRLRPLGERPFALLDGEDVLRERGEGRRAMGRLGTACAKVPLPGAECVEPVAVAVMGKPADGRGGWIR